MNVLMCEFIYILSPQNLQIVSFAAFSDSTGLHLHDPVQISYPLGSLWDPLTEFLSSFLLLPRASVYASFKTFSLCVPAMILKYHRQVS
jgi:hypothetical protein